MALDGNLQPVIFVKTFYRILFMPTRCHVPFAMRFTAHSQHRQNFLESYFKKMIVGAFKAEQCQNKRSKPKEGHIEHLDSLSPNNVRLLASSAYIYILDISTSHSLQVGFKAMYNIWYNKYSNKHSTYSREFFLFFHASSK